MSRRLPRWRGLEQDKAVAQKTALCRISSLPAGALAFQRSEDRSDTAERCRRLVCHNQGGSYYTSHHHLSPFHNCFVSFRMLQFIIGQTVLTQRLAIHWCRRSQLSSWRLRRRDDHHRRVEIPRQGQVWTSEQANVTTSPLLVVIIVSKYVITTHQYVIFIQN